MITGCHYQETQFQKPFLNLKITREKKHLQIFSAWKNFHLFHFGVLFSCYRFDGERIGYLCSLVLIRDVTYLETMGKFLTSL